MRKIIYLGSIVWLSFAVLPVAAEDCGLRPDKPQLPDGKIAGPEEMKNGLDSTGEYTSALEKYAACLVSLAQKNVIWYLSPFRDIFFLFLGVKFKEIVNVGIYIIK